MTVKVGQNNCALAVWRLDLTRLFDLRHLIWPKSAYLSWTWKSLITSLLLNYPSNHAQGLQIIFNLAAQRSCLLSGSCWFSKPGLESRSKDGNILDGLRAVWVSFGPHSQLSIPKILESHWLILEPSKKTLRLVSLKSA